MHRLDYDRRPDTSGTANRRTKVLQVVIAVIAMAPSIYMAMCGWCVWFWSFAAEPGHTPPHLVRLMHCVLFAASPLGIASLYLTGRLADRRGFAWVWLNWVIAAAYVGVLQLVQHLMRTA